MWVTLFFRRNKKVRNKDYLSIEKHFKSYHELRMYLFTMRVKHNRRVLALIKEG